MTPSTKTLDWLTRQGITTKNDKVVLYKCVDKNLYSTRGRVGYYGSTKRAFMSSPYTPGSTLTAPDWRDDYSCGYGLHLCATPSAASNYGSYSRRKRYLACEVNVDDIRVVGNDKVKVRTLKVLCEVNVHKRPVADTLLGALATNRKNGMTYRVRAVKDKMVALQGTPNLDKVKLIKQSNLSKSYSISYSA